MIIIETQAVGPFFKNGFVVACARTRDGVMIDPGDEVDGLLQFVRRERINVRHILLTHAHVDHVTGVGTAKRELGVPVYLHRDDRFLYERAVQQGQMFGLRLDPPPPPIDHFYSSEEIISFGDFRVRSHHTPGHCPGGVCLAVSPAAGGPASAPEARRRGRAEAQTLSASEGGAGRVEEAGGAGRAGEAGGAGRAGEAGADMDLFVGDTLFAGSIGRTDLPGGDYPTLIRSIRTVLFAFGDAARVYPGHGPQTTIGKERRTNPFLSESRG